MRDSVNIKNLQVSANVGRDFWKRPILLPLQLSLSIKTSFAKASETDDLRYSLNYATISRNVMRFCKERENQNFGSLEKFAHAVVKELPNNTTLTVSSSKSQIRCRNIEVEVCPPHTTIRINGLRLLTVIGVFTFERLEKQIVELDIRLKSAKPVDYFSTISEITEYVEKSNFKTVEALVANVSHIVLTSADQCTVSVLKPNAIAFTDGVGVSVERTRLDLPSLPKVEFSKDFSQQFDLPDLRPEEEAVQEMHCAYLAFGTNVGNQVQNIEKALSFLQSAGITVDAVSSLYRSRPMYHLEQEDFLNGVVKVTTGKSAQDLLLALKEIEYEKMSRTKDFDNGPRLIDLDILLYDNIILSEPNLNIPHIKLVERSFVLSPLCELISPNELHPVTAETFHAHRKQLIDSATHQNGDKVIDSSVQASIDLTSVVPLRRGSFLEFGHETKIMGILNVTPDSFSDGGVNVSAPLDAVQDMCSNGVDIIDIGGCSTRPGSQQVSEDEELQRVLPVVESIRKSGNAKAIISIDTYRSAVAEQCILAGADIINDISGGLFDAKIYDVVAKYGVPYIVNHTRGDISTMSKMNQYSSEAELDEFTSTKNEVVLSVARELSEVVGNCMERGVKRWQIIIDPGIGFAKNGPQNISVIKGIPDIKSYSVQGKEFISLERLPMLVGVSRKKFIGDITKVSEPSERVIGSCGLNLVCAQLGADLVRVHDYKETKQVLLLADAMKEY